MDFKQAKQRKERGTSVDDLSKQLQEQKDQYTDLVMVGIKEDGSFDVGYSTDNNAKAIGYLEMAKEEIIAELMYEDI